jgi:hypothetical protein
MAHDKTDNLFCPERRIGCFDKGDPTEIRIPWRARLILVHDVAKANPSIQVCKADGAPCPRMPKGARVGAERWDAGARHTRLLGHCQHEPKPEPRWERENRIGTRRLLHNRRVNRAWVEEAYAIQRPASRERTIDSGY